MNNPLSAALIRLSRTRSDIDREIGAARVIAVTGQRLQHEVEDLRQRVELHTRAAAVLTSIGEERQHLAQQQIEGLVTKGLRTIFGDELSFHIVPAVRAKVPVIDFVIRSTLNDGTVVDTDIMDARGGGLAATVGALLRIVVLLLSPDRQDTVLLLDETFAHVSAEYQPRLAEFIRELVDQTPIQVIMVTHSDVFADAADTRYRFDQVDGITRVRAV